MRLYEAFELEKEEVVEYQTRVLDEGHFLG